MTTLDYATVPNTRPSKALLWTGRVISALPILAMTMSAAMKFAKPPAVVLGFEHLGYPQRLILPIAILELACVVVYAIPRTAVLGAILMTAYLGAATATHVRIGEMFIMQPALGALVWLGLLLRDARLRPLLPLRM